MRGIEKDRDKEVVNDMIDMHKVDKEVFSAIENLYFVDI